MADANQTALVDKFFDPVINGKDAASIREWLRKQDADEMELFLNFWNWRNFRDREMLVRQELERLRAKTGGWDAIELKPGIWGMSFDLKRFGKWLQHAPWLRSK